MKRATKIMEAQPGGHYWVVDQNGPVSQHAFGFSDAGPETQVESDTPFAVFSVTKFVTAVVIIRLSEKGVFDLSTPLSTYYPDHPYGDVTIEQLLSHTSGVPNPMPIRWFYLESERFDPDETLKQIVGKHPKIKNAPGARYLYSNLGYWILEKVVESATGASFEEAIQSEIFEVVGVTSKQASFRIPDNIATGHSKKWAARNAVFALLTPRRWWIESTGRWSRHPNLYNFGKAYGGLYCTPHALASVLVDLLRPDSRLLSRSGREKLADVSARGEVSGHTYYGKQGGGLGFHANIRLYPELGIGTVWMSNQTEVSATPIDRNSDALDAEAIERLSK